MDPPLKRPKLARASFDDDSDEENDELSMTLDQFVARQDPMYKLDKQRAKAADRLKFTFEGIFDKYEKDFTGVGDEIDLRTGEVIVDNGHLQSLEDEKDRKSDGSVSNDEEERISRGNKPLTKALVVAKVPSQNRIKAFPTGPLGGTPYHLSSSAFPSPQFGMTNPFSFGYSPFGSNPIDPAWQVPDIPLPLHPHNFNYGNMALGYPRSNCYSNSSFAPPGSASLNEHIAGSFVPRAFRQLVHANSFNPKAQQPAESNDDGIEEDEILLTRDKQDPQESPTTQEIEKSVKLASFLRSTSQEIPKQTSSPVTTSGDKVLGLKQGPVRSRKPKTPKKPRIVDPKTEAVSQSIHDNAEHSTGGGVLYSSIESGHSPGRQKNTVLDQQSPGSKDQILTKAGQRHSGKTPGRSKLAGKNQAPVEKEIQQSGSSRPNEIFVNELLSRDTPISIARNVSRIPDTKPTPVSTSVNTASGASFSDQISATNSDTPENLQQRRSARARKQTEFYGKLSWSTRGARPFAHAINANMQKLDPCHKSPGKSSIHQRTHTTPSIPDRRSQKADESRGNMNDGTEVTREWEEITQHGKLWDGVMPNNAHSISVELSGPPCATDAALSYSTFELAIPEFIDADAQVMSLHQAGKVETKGTEISGQTAESSMASDRDLPCYLLDEDESTLAGFATSTAILANVAEDNSTLEAEMSESTSGGTVEKEGDPQFDIPSSSAGSRLDHSISDVPGGTDITELPSLSTNIQNTAGTCLPEDRTSHLRPDITTGTSNNTALTSRHDNYQSGDLCDDAETTASPRSLEQDLRGLQCEMKLGLPNAVEDQYNPAADLTLPSPPNESVMKTSEACQLVLRPLPRCKNDNSSSSPKVIGRLSPRRAASSSPPEIRQQVTPSATPSISKTPTKGPKSRDMLKEHLAIDHTHATPTKKRRALTSLIPDDQADDDDELSIISASSLPTTPSSFRAKLSRASQGNHPFSTPRKTNRKASLLLFSSHRKSQNISPNHNFGIDGRRRDSRTPQTFLPAMDVGPSPFPKRKLNTVQSLPLARTFTDYLLDVTPRHNKKRVSPVDSETEDGGVRTPNGTGQRCGEDGFICDRDFCFTCCK